MPSSRSIDVALFDFSHRSAAREMSTESVKVAVRVRPFNNREKDRNATCIIRMVGVKTLIINPDTQEEKEFAFVRIRAPQTAPPLLLTLPWAWESLR